MSGPWKSGFYDGVLSALAILAANGGPFTVEYSDVVRQCGGADLLRAAKRRDDSQTENIRYALNQMVASTPPEIVP